MKKFLSIILTLAIMLTVLPFGLFTIPTAAADGNTTEFAGGSGTAEDPYLISTKTHLDNVRNYLSSNFKLINDIEFTEADFAEGGDFYNEGAYWIPIGLNGDSYTSFTGVFDGGNYIISNLKINRPTTNLIGLFCRLGYNGAIKNTILQSSEIVGQNCVGGICGYAQATADEYYKTQKYGLIEHCFVSGDIQGVKSIGGICGRYYIGSTNSGQFRLSDGVIRECYNSANITATEEQAGGIVGSVLTSEYAYQSLFKITKCVNSGTITATSAVGGILGFYDGQLEWTSVGHYTSELEITKSYNCSNIIGTNEYTSKQGIHGEWTSGERAYYTIYSVGNSPIIPDFSDWDFDTDWTLGGIKDYEYPELRCFTIAGSVNFEGNAVYNSIVTANISQIEKLNNTLTYEWFVENVSVGNENTYKIKAEDIGKKLRLEVTSTYPMNMGTLYSEEVTIGKAPQPTTPTIPELLSLNDNCFEITTVSTQEYSIDNINWQKSGIFTNLDPNKKYVVYSRILENDLYLLGNSTKVLEITTDRRALTGSVAIKGTARYGDTLTADVSNVGPANVTYTLEWRTGTKVLGTGSSYTVTKADIGNNITLVAIGVDDFIGTLTSASVTATKTTVQLPNAPVVSDKTNISVTLVSKTGYEYSKDKVTWQSSPVFTGLSAATEYTFYQRVKETDTTFASIASSGTKVTTLKNNVSAPLAPEIVDVTNTTVTLKKIEGYQYSKDGLTWQNSNVFTGLNPFTEYAFCQRIAENEVDYASPQSSYTRVMTLKNTIKAPSAPTIASATETTVTLKAISGYQYSIDGTTWQNSNIFRNLETLKTYNFYQRIAETEVDYASDSSAAVSFKLKYIAPQTAKPVLKEFTNNKIVVETVSGTEFSIDNVNWQSGGTFTNLKPNTKYSIYARTLESDTHYAGEVSLALNVTTLKNTVAKPAAPKSQTITHNSITLVAISGGEYSKDGTTWQTSNVFTGLSPNKTYTFYQRVAETNESYVSEISASATFKTLKQTLSATSAPTVSAKTADSVTLVKVNGYEYSKDGTTWQTSNVFSDLSPNTLYTFYQRIAETDTSYATEKSAGLTVTTPKKSVTTPAKPVVSKVAQTSVTLVAYAGYEYSIDGTTWQTSNVFTGLSLETTYSFYQRVAETSTSFASSKSEGLSVTTLPKGECLNKPVKPIVVMSDYNNIELLNIEGYEYKLGDGEWQSSPKFSGLKWTESYTLYQRIKETATHKASASSEGVVVNLDMQPSVQLCYGMLEDYINIYGTTLSNGNKRVTKLVSSTYIYLENTSQGIYCSTMSSSSSGNYKFIYNFGFLLTADDRYIDGELTIDVYMNNNRLTSSNPTATFDRSTYTSESIIYIDGSEVGSMNHEMFNNQLKLLTIAMHIFLSEDLSCGIGGVGFLDFTGENDRGFYCDAALNHQIGNKVLKYSYAATCEREGYTGDYCCSYCGGVIEKGKVIPALNGHKYSNSCDTECNECGFKREIDHTYTDNCDANCNVCNAEREVNHLYDNECDANCNDCGFERKVPHIYDNSNDLICNNCGYERLPYTPGDIDGVEGVTDRDAVHLLYHTFLPDMYPVNQDCDFNGDNEVNDKDAVYLLYYTFLPNLYPIA